MSILLATGAQAVHVLNNPALHVNVVHLPDDPLAKQGLQAAKDTLTYTVKAYHAAVIAAWIALAAFGLTFIETRNNSREFKEFLRRPKLLPKFWAAVEYDVRAQYRQCIVGIKIRNEGDRLTRDCIIELFVPVGVFPNQIGPEPTRVVENQTCCFWVREVPHTLYPNGVEDKVDNRISFMVDNAVKSFVIRWRIYDDAGNYPEKGLGRFNVTAPSIEELERVGQAQ